MKPTAFNYADYAQAVTERDRARLDCAVAERNHMNTLERLLEAQERIDELKGELSEYNCDTKIGCPLIEQLKAENKALRNELCFKCGQYREAHNGACNGCRWTA